MSEFDRDYEFDDDDNYEMGEEVPYYGDDDNDGIVGKNKSFDKFDDGYDDFHYGYDDEWYF